MSSCSLKIPRDFKSRFWNCMILVALCECRTAFRMLDQGLSVWRLMVLKVLISAWARGSRCKREIKSTLGVSASSIPIASFFHVVITARGLRLVQVASVPRFTNVIRSMKTVCEVKIRKSKMKLRLIPMYNFLTGSPLPEELPVIFLTC
jgi:hypothetical protein